MTPNARNIAVGLTVIVALAMLGGMILIFAGLPQMFQAGYEIKIKFDATYDAYEGDPIHLIGMRVGRITKIRFSDPADPARGVTFTARIDSDVRLPGNVKAFLFTKGLIGSAYVELKPDGPEQLDPSTGKPIKFLPTDRVTIIEGVHIGSGLLPEELTPALKGLSKLADNLNRLIAPKPPDAPTTTQAAGAPGGLEGTIEKLNATLDALKNFAVDARESTRQLSKTASTAEGRINELAEKLIENAEKISTLMTVMNKTVMKIESGKGTAGLLINDPALYNNLLETSRQMSGMLEEFRQLIQIWKKRITIKLE